MLLYVCVLFLQGLDCQSLRDPVIRTPREWGAISPNMHMRDLPPPPIQGDEAELRGALSMLATQVRETD